MLDYIDVCSLVQKKHENLIKNYCSYLDCGWKHYQNNKIESSVRLKKTDLLEKAIRKEFPLPESLLAKLQKDFVKENLSLYLLLDVLPAWRYLAADRYPSSEEQLSELTNFAISPLGRMILALYDENPAAYHPLNSLLIMNFWMQLFISKSPVVSKVKLSKKQTESKLRGLLKNSVVLLNLLDSKRTKFRAAAAIKKSELMLNKFKNNEQIKLTILDKIRVFLYSFAMFLAAGKRTIYSKR